MGVIRYGGQYPCASVRRYTSRPRWVSIRSFINAGAAPLNAMEPVASHTRSHERHPVRLEGGPSRYPSRGVSAPLSRFIKCSAIAMLLRASPSTLSTGSTLDITIVEMRYPTALVRSVVRIHLRCAKCYHCHPPTPTAIDWNAAQVQHREHPSRSDSYL